MSWSTCRCGDGGAGPTDGCTQCGGHRPWARRRIGRTINASDTLSAPPIRRPEIPLVEPNDPTATASTAAVRTEETTRVVPLNSRS